MENKLQNEYISINYYTTGRPYIIIRDLKDVYNEQTAFTRNIRGISKAWQFINQIMSKEELKHDLKLFDIVKILDDKFNLKMHVYCAVD